jgi:hypothetical protein
MARSLHRLSDRTVRTVGVGIYRGGGGLYLQLTAGKVGQLKRSLMERPRRSAIQADKGIQVNNKMVKNTQASRTPDIRSAKMARSWRVKPVRTGLRPHAFPQFIRPSGASALASKKSGQLLVRTSEREKGESFQDVKSAMSGVLNLRELDVN